MDPNFFPPEARSNGGLRNARPAPDLNPVDLPIPAMVYRAFAFRVQTEDRTEFELRMTPVVPLPNGSFTTHGDRHFDWLLSPESMLMLVDNIAQVLSPEQKAEARKLLSDVVIPPKPEIVKP